MNAKLKKSLLWVSLIVPIAAASAVSGWIGLQSFAKAQVDATIREAEEKAPFPLAIAYESLRLNLFRLEIQIVNPTLRVGPPVNVGLRAASVTWSKCDVFHEISRHCDVHFQGLKPTADDPEYAAEIAALERRVGVPLVFNFFLQHRYDPNAHHAIQVHSILQLVGVGKVGASVNLSGLSLEDVRHRVGQSDMMMLTMLTKLQVHSLRLSYNDGGLLNSMQRQGTKAPNRDWKKDKWRLFATNAQARHMQRALSSFMDKPTTATLLFEPAAPQTALSMTLRFQAKGLAALKDMGASLKLNGAGMPLANLLTIKESRAVGDTPF